jgi:hypothetical protein
MMERQRRVNEMRSQLAASIATEKEAIQEQAVQARASLEVESRLIARDISSRVLNRSVSDSGIN